MTTSTTAREHLHRLVDELPDGELHAAARFLEYLHDLGSDPLMRLLDEAPEDDEPLTPEEEAALAEGEEAYRRGDYRPWEAVREELARE
ncbi:MAG: hypothetical protein HY691_09645 [Chloroflexi bacterium]|nr:hypothetical protein [Chloroflexota bacterium]